MTLEIYDEVSRNNAELANRLVRHDKITFDVLLDELSSLDKVVFIPHSTLQQIGIPDNTSEVFTNKKLFYKKLGANYDGQALFFGFLASTRPETIEQALMLYNSAFQEGVGQPHH